jgi:hypothetical protein
MNKKRINKRLGVLLFLTLGGLCIVAESSANTSKEFCIINQKLIDVLKTYEILSGRPVEIVAGVYSPYITIQADAVTDDQKIKLIERELSKYDIGLFHISSNRVVAAWREPVKDPARKFLNYCKKNHVSYDMGAISVNSKISPRIAALAEKKEEALKRLNKILMKDSEYKAYLEDSKGFPLKDLDERIRLQERRG